MTPVEEIKERINIVDLVSEYVQLKQAGTNHKGLCPFHNEKSPSFTVSEPKQFYHCFGCSKGGDIFTFIQEVEGVEFPEALRMLATKAGVELRSVDPKEQSEKTRLLDALQLATDFFTTARKQSQEGQVARAYIEERGVNAETAEMFQLGYSGDSWDALMNFLKKKKYSEKEIERAGLVVPSKKTGKYYDRFRGRLMFPLHNAHGNVIGFTARALKEDEEGAKYINTPQTDVYNKSAVLYGLHLAKKYIQKMDAAVIVEGQVDVVAAHQAKFRNVVASSGTALTEEQVRLLKRYSDNVILAFDADAAGVKAAWRGMKIAIENGMNIKVMRMPVGKDPDDLIREDPQQFRQIALDAKPFMEYAFSAILEPLDMSAAHDKKKAAAELLPMIALFPDKIEQSHYAQQLAEQLGVDVAILLEKLEPAAQQKTPAQRQPAPAEQQMNTTAPTPEKTRDDKLAERLLALISLQSQDMQLVVERITPEMIGDELLQSLYTELLSLYNQRGSLDSQAPELNHQLRGKWQELTLIAEELYADFSTQERQQELLTVIESVERAHITRRLTAIERELAVAEKNREQDRIDSLSEELTSLTETLKTLR